MKKSLQLLWNYLENCFYFNPLNGCLSFSLLCDRRSAFLPPSSHHVRCWSMSTQMVRCVLTCSLKYTWARWKWRSDIPGMLSGAAGTGRDGLRGIRPSVYWFSSGSGWCWERTNRIIMLSVQNGHLCEVTMIWIVWFTYYPDNDDVRRGSDCCSPIGWLSPPSARSRGPTSPWCQDQTGFRIWL